MASDMLKAILDVEQECARAEAAAVKQAETDKQEAKRKAAALVEQAQQQAEALLADNEQDLRRLTQKDEEAARKESAEQCAGIVCQADKNRSKVVLQVVDLLTGQTAG